MDATDKRIKCLLQVGSAKYRVFMVPDKPQPVYITVDSFRSSIHSNYPELAHILTPVYALEIWDEDFQEFVRLDDFSEIQDLSKLRARKIEEHDYWEQCCCCQGTCGETCPGPQTDWEQNGNQEQVSKKKRKPSKNEKSVGKERKKSESASANTVINKLQDLVANKPVLAKENPILSEPFHLKRLEEMKALIDSIVVHISEFKSTPENQRGQFWDLISQEMQLKGFDYKTTKTGDACKKTLNDITAQYSRILTSKISETDAQKLWPLFSYFHHQYELISCHNKMSKKRDKYIKEKSTSESLVDKMLEMSINKLEKKKVKNS